MRIAIVAAGFTLPKTDGLRKDSPFKAKGLVSQFEKLINGMLKNGFTPKEYAERVFKQLEVLGVMVFPKAIRQVLHCWYMYLHGSVLLSRCICLWLIKQSAHGLYAPAQIVSDALQSCR